EADGTAGDAGSGSGARGAEHAPGPLARQPGPEPDLDRAADAGCPGPSRDQSPGPGCPSDGGSRLLRSGLLGGSAPALTSTGHRRSIAGGLFVVEAPSTFPLPARL